MDTNVRQHGNEREHDRDHESDHENDTESTASENTEFSYGDDYDEYYEYDEPNEANEPNEHNDQYSYNYDSNFQINLSNNRVNKNVLLIPEIYNKYVHGRTFDSDPTIDGQFLVLQTFYINPNNNMFEFFKYVNNLCKFYKRYNKKNYCSLSFPHTLLRNYNNIIKKPNYLNLEIGQIYYLKGSECVCIIKTFWLKIIQRAWKRVYKIRKHIRQLRCRPDSILYRQFTGTWQEKCKFMPSIRGMLL
jgi:hypothetical protein